MVFVGGDVPEQSYLLPPDVREWLPAGHLAWALRDMTAQMDLWGFRGWYRADGQGRPAYDPAMMVTLICYCYCKGIRSSRAIEAATFDDLGAGVICGNTHPDHSTAARFLARHQDAVKGLLVASVTACARQGLVSVDVVAGDGTKIRASASASANAAAGALDEQIAGLEKVVAAEVDAWIAQARAEDAIQDALPGLSIRGDSDRRGDGSGDGSGGDSDDGDGDGDDGSGRPVRDGRRAAATLARRLDARARLAAADQARQDQAVR